MHACWRGLREGYMLLPPPSPSLPYTPEIVCVEGRHRNHRVVAQVAVGHAVAATTRGPHGRHKLHILDLAECELLAVVPATVVHKLPQQLDGRLGAVLLNLQARSGEDRLGGDTGHVGKHARGQMVVTIKGCNPPPSSVTMTPDPKSPQAPRSSCRP